MAKTPSIKAQEMRWKAEDALRTLSRAEEIRSDKSLMRAVQNHAKAQVAALSKVASPAKRTTRTKK